MCTVLCTCALCTPYLKKEYSNCSFLAWKTKTLGKQSKICTVHCKMCTVRTLIAKKYSIRMFMKSKFTPAHQNTVFYLEKQKSWENGAKCALCCALCAPYLKKEYSNVYEIQIHACTPKSSSLAWKTKKLGKRCKMCAVQCKMCTVRTLIAKKYSIRMFMKSKFVLAHQITAL